MAWVAGIRFKPVGKIYYFECKKIDLQAGDAVIVESIRGVECGSVAIGKREMSEKDLVLPLKSVVRKATEADIRNFQKNKQREQEAMEICRQKVKEHRLPMRLIDIEYTFDMSKVIFYFTAEGRVDFRELVKDLAAIFRNRIELRQIGVRDEAKILGGLGTCGRVLCCHCFLGEFEPVSIRMAKEQNLSLNPTKISGICGRLMCCLKYESEIYDSAKGDGEEQHGRESAGVEIDLKGIDIDSGGDQGPGGPARDRTGS